MRPAQEKPVDAREKEEIENIPERGSASGRQDDLP